MPPTRMWVNGTDLATLDLWIDSPEAWGHGLQRSDQVISAPGGAGGLVATAAAVTSPRAWAVTGMLYAATVMDARAKWDALKFILASPWLEVMIEPWTDRMSLCRFQNVEWQPQDMDAPGWRFLLTFLSPSPYLVSPLVDSYGLLSGEELTITLGTAPSPFRAFLFGPATSPRLVYYDGNGILRGNLAFNVTLAAQEWISFDSQTRVMEHHAASGVTQGAAKYLSGSAQLFQLDPLDGAVGGGPTLLLDATAGADVKAVIHTRRAWV